MRSRYDPIDALFLALVRWLVLLMLKHSGTGHEHRRMLHRCLHAIDTMQPAAAAADAAMPDAVVTILSSGQLYRLFAELILGLTWPKFDRPMNSTDAHAVIIEALLRIGRLTPEHVARDQIEPTVLAGDNPFAADVHSSVMSALVRSMDERELAIAPRVVRAVRQFASYSAAAEAPRDPEEAVLLWFQKVTACVNSVLLHAGEETTPVLSAENDFYAALRDGGALGAIIAYYRPDLLDMDQLQLQGGPSSDVAAAAHNLRVTLNAASRASVPCPLKADDLLNQSPLLRFVALSWAGQLFCKFEELPISSRLPHKKGVKVDSADPTSPEPSRGASPSQHTSQMSAGGRPAARRSSKTANGTQALFTAQTYAMLNETTRPHQTIKSAARPVNERQGTTRSSTIPAAEPNSRTLVDRGSTKFKRYASDADRFEAEDQEWRDRELDEEAMMAVTNLITLDDNGTSAAQTQPTAVSLHCATAATCRDNDDDSESADFEIDPMTVSQLHAPVPAPFAAMTSSAPSPPARAAANPLSSTSTGMSAAPAPMAAALTSSKAEVYPFTTTVHAPVVEVRRPRTAVAWEDPAATTPVLAAKVVEVPRPRTAVTRQEPTAARLVLAAAVLAPSLASTVLTPPLVPTVIPHSTTPDDETSSAAAPVSMPPPSPETRKLGRRLSAKLVQQLIDQQAEEAAALEEAAAAEIAAASALKAATRAQAKAAARPNKAAALPPAEVQCEFHDDDDDGRSSSSDESEEEKQPTPVLERKHPHLSRTDIATYPGEVQEALLATEEEALERLRATAMRAAAALNKRMVDSDVDIETASVDTRASYTICKHNSSSNVRGLLELAKPSVASELASGPPFLAQNQSSSRPSSARRRPGSARQGPRQTPSASGHTIDDDVGPIAALTDSSNGNNLAKSASGYDDLIVEEMTEVPARATTPDVPAICTAELAISVNEPSQPAPSEEPTEPSTSAVEEVTEDDGQRRAQWTALQQALGFKRKEISTLQQSQKMLWNQNLGSLAKAALEQVNAPNVHEAGVFTVESSQPHPPTPKRSTWMNGVVAEAPIRALPSAKKGKVVKPSAPGPAVTRPAVSEPEPEVDPHREVNDGSAGKRRVTRFEIPMAATGSPREGPDAVFAKRQRQLEARAKKREADKVDAKRRRHEAQMARDQAAKEQSSLQNSNQGNGPAVRSPKRATDINQKGPKNGAGDVKRSNRKLIMNAIKHTCLAGPVNQTSKDTVLKELDACEAAHYVVLLHDPNDVKYRALYSWDFDTCEARKLAGRGPSKIKAGSVLRAFRYNSGTRRFSPARTNTITTLIDAICIATKTKKNPGLI